MGRKINQSQVAVIIGSDNDRDVIEPCLTTLDEFDLSYELRILSAHRTPKDLARYVEALEGRGVKVIIAAAGLSAALPGAVAAHTPLPVIGVPINAGTLGGLDALLSMSQMPPGVPVATVTIGSAGAKNAALLAVRILALANKTLAKKLREAGRRQRRTVLAKDRQARTHPPT